MSWFPMAQDLIENPFFKVLPPTTKLYYLWCISEFNLRGPFYRSDLEVAVTLHSAVVTIRKARRLLTALGWLETRPGTRAGGRPLATRYYFVKWSTTKECTWFAQQQRLAYEMMLAMLRNGMISPGDVWVYLCLSYLQWRYHLVGENDAFSVSKRVLAEMSGLHDAGTRVKRLHERCKYSCDSPLFHLRGYQQLIITNWSLPDSLETEENENNRQAVEQWSATIKEQVRFMRVNDLASPRQLDAWQQRQRSASTATRR
ncbi:MAG: hypothetical protein ACYDCO_10510 [Armatimonadota bacterium]